MRKDRHAPNRLLAATTLAVVLLAVPTNATARKPGFVSRARHALLALGVRQAHISCSRTGRCRWRGLYRGRGCSGSIRVHGRGRMRLSTVRCATTPQPPPSPAPPLLFGFNTYTDQQTVARQRELGAKVTRLFVDWWQVEPQQGVWDWSAVDDQYRQVLAGGLRPLLVVNGAPCWAESNCSLLFEAPPAPGLDADWSAYVRAVAMRYPDAVGVEVWNEPNLAAAFYPQADPARYTQLLGEAYAAVKSVNKAMPVISGGVAMNDAAGAGGPGYASRTFLAGMYAAGARRYMDGLAIHVYPTDLQSGGTSIWDPAAMSRWLEQAKDVTSAAGVPPVPIWITETGVSTSTEPGFPPAVTPGQQASDLLSMIRTARADLDVRAVMIHSLQDANPDVVGQLVDDLTGSLLNLDISYNGLQAGVGVFTNTWVPKPAACGLSRAFGGSLAC
jgi:hypothetical protein